MQSLNTTLAGYLRHIGQYEPQALGKGPRQLTTEDNQFLRDSLNRQLKFNNSMIVVMMVLLSGLFLLGAYLLLHHKDSFDAIKVISGGTFACLLGIIGTLRRIWLDKSRIDLLVHASYSMSPTEAAKFVTSFYFKTQARSSARTNSRKTRAAR